MTVNARINAQGETKGEEIKRELLALLTPSQRAGSVVWIRKDTRNLTKVTIRSTLLERDEGGTLAEQS